MDTGDITPLLDQLESNIDDLEEALAPLLESNISTVAAKLPLLDKAKLHVLTTYALESILFSVLNLDGVNAREHAVFRELTRVKQYFGKIKEAEDGGENKRENLSLDKDAAGRMVKHALAGNGNQNPDKLDKERAAAKAKLDEMRDMLDKKQPKQKSKKRKLDDESSAATPITTSSDQRDSINEERGAEDQEDERKRRKREKNKRKKENKKLRDLEVLHQNASANDCAAPDGRVPGEAPGSEPQSDDSVKAKQGSSYGEASRHAEAALPERKKGKNQRTKQVHGKQKSDRPPKDSKAVLQHLLGRDGTA